MNKLKKVVLLFTIITLTLITPFKVLAEGEQPKPPVEEQKEGEQPKPAEEQKEGEQPKEELNNEGVEVDENNDNPYLELTNEEQKKKDQSIRDKEIISKPIETPASVTGERYKGSGTVVDFTTTGSKAFYTVKAQDNSVYYIVIDMDMTEDNVYFMSEINGEELSLKDIASKNNSNEDKPKPPAQPQKKKSNPVFFIVLIGAIGLFGYQFFFGKLKNLNPMNSDKEEKDNNKNKDEDEVDIYNDEKAKEGFLVKDEDDE